MAVSWVVSGLTPCGPTCALANTASVMNTLSLLGDNDIFSLRTRFSRVRNFIIPSSKEFDTMPPSSMKSSRMILAMRPWQCSPVTCPNSDGPPVIPRAFVGTSGKRDLDLEKLKLL